MLIVNELSHIQRWEFAENLMDNADGVAQGIVMVATNAGFKGTKAEVWRNTAITSDNWETHILAAPAPWHDKETIAEAKRRNPPGRYNRLWRGIWASGKGDALNEEDVDAVFRLRGPLLAPEKGWDYLVGLDLGISHDHAGVCVLGINTEQRKLKTAILRGWEPLGDPPEVDLIDVQSFVFAMNQLFRPLLVLYDPTEARLMAQQLRRKGVPMCEMTFSSTTNLTKMAESLIQVVEGHVLAAYDDPDGRLRRDFGKFNIVEKPYGYKLEAVSDEFGHADVGTALVICLPQAMDMLQGLAVLRPDDKLTYDEGGDLTDAEIASMDPELREIYEMDEKDHPAWDRDW